MTPAVTSVDDAVQAPPGLDAWLAAARATPEPDGVSEVDIGGVRCVVKRRRRPGRAPLDYGLRYVRAASLSAFCRLFLGEFPSPKVLLRNGLADEAQRLRHWRARGCAVPAVYAEEPGMLVLAYVGTSFPGHLRRADAPTRLALLRAAGEDLARFHQAGGWHGGAQLRNITMLDGCRWRIDFEENIGGALSLPLAQAYDVLQASLSLMGLGRIQHPDWPAMGQALLDGYLSVQDDALVREQLRAMARTLGRVARPLRPVLARLPWRDVQGFLRTADLMQSLSQP